VPRESLLLSLAEVSVALTGFAGVVVFLGRRAAGDWTEADQVRFASMVEFGLIALLFSLLPLPLWEVLGTPTATWGAASGIAAVALGVGLTAGFRRTARVRASGDLEASVRGAYVALALTAALIVALILNSIGVLLERVFLPYLLAILLCLYHAGHLFLRLLRFR
jgi:hypothetical protein